MNTRIQAGVRARTRFLTIALALATFVVGCATLPRPVDSGQLVFWEIRPTSVTGGDPGAVAHLLGSVHIGRDDIVFDPAIREAKASADVLVFEVAREELAPELLTRLQGELGRLPPGESLEEVLPAETWRRLARTLAAAGLPSAAVSRFKPWMAMLTMMSLQLQDAGLDREKGVEQQLMAAQPERPTIGLESALLQMQLLDDLPLDTQIALLDDTLADSGGAENVVDLTLDTWAAGDLELMALLVSPPGRKPHQVLFHERVFVERNRRMADRMATLLEQPGRYFVTVGAGHTVGATGLPTLLREAGFQVRRVPRTPAAAER